MSFAKRGEGFFVRRRCRREQHADAVAGQAKEGLRMGLPSGPAFVVVGARGGIVQGGERGQEHRAFEPWIEVPDDFVVGARPA